MFVAYTYAILFHTHNFLHTMSQKRLSLQYTDPEWAVIEKIISDSEQKDLMAFIGKKLSKITESLDKNVDCDEQVVTKRMRQIRTAPYISKMLKQLECRYGLDAGTLVSRLIIFPALKDYYDKNGY